MPIGRHGLSRAGGSAARGSRRCPGRRGRRRRLAAGRIRRHRHRDLIGISVDRTAHRVDAKTDDAAENDVSGSHCFGVRWDDARSRDIAFLGALNRQRCRALRQCDAARRRHCFVANCCDRSLRHAARGVRDHHQRNDAARRDRHTRRSRCRVHDHDVELTADRSRIC